MKKLFVPMLDRPESRIIGSAIGYWFFAFLTFPFVIALFSLDEGQLLYGDWIDLIYHLLNFLVVIAIFAPYLRESFLGVQLNTDKFLTTMVICTAAIILLKLSICTLTFFIPNPLWMNAAFGCLMTTESDVAFYSDALLATQPLLGTLCVILLTPFTTSCLIYACVFAPVCNRRPWLAYLLVAVALLAIQVLKVLGLWSWEQQLVNFAVQLAVHLIACLSYQITDTVWTPIAVHSLSNLGLSLIYRLYII